MLATARTTPRWWPRFATAALHVDLAVLSLALLVAHVTVTVMDDWVEIGWADAVLPFRAGYRPLWTGLGTVAALLVVTAALTAGPGASCRRRSGGAPTTSPTSPGRSRSCTASAPARTAAAPERWP